MKKKTENDPSMNREKLQSAPFWGQGTQILSKFASEAGPVTGDHSK